MSEEELSLAERELAIQEEAALQEKIREYTGAVPEPKYNVHTFLNEVLKTPDTTKVGNLTLPELGMPKLPVRTDKELALFAEKVMHNSFLHDYFASSAEITLATSLSLNAKLITLAVTQRRMVADESKPRVVNKGWFKSKSSEEEQ